MHFFFILSGFHWLYVPQHSSADRRLGCFHVLAVVPSATINDGYLLQFWFPWGICPIVGLLDSVVVLFLVF